MDHHIRHLSIDQPPCLTFSPKSACKSTTCGEWNSFADTTATSTATSAQAMALNIVIGDFFGGLRTKRTWFGSLDCGEQDDLPMLRYDLDINVSEDGLSRCLHMLRDLAYAQTENSSFIASCCRVKTPGCSKLASEAGPTGPKHD